MAASALSGAEITKGIWTRENVELLSWSALTQKRGQQDPVSPESLLDKLRVIICGKYYVQWWIPLQPCASQVTSLSLLKVGSPLLITRVAHSVPGTHCNALNLACSRTPGLGTVSDQGIVPPCTFHCHQPSYNKQVCIFKNSANMHSIHACVPMHTHSSVFLGIKQAHTSECQTFSFIIFSGLGEFTCRLMEHHHMVFVTCNVLPCLCPDVRTLTWLFTDFTFSSDS